MPDACLGVDSIVGFPGETSNNFYETLDFLSMLEISYCHVFPYSERQNTDALQITQKLPKTIITERRNIIHQLSNNKKHQFYKKNIGKLQKVLIENWENDILYGLSENYIPIKICGEFSEINQIIKIKLNNIQGNRMLGERLN